MTPSAWLDPFGLAPAADKNFDGFERAVTHAQGVLVKVEADGDGGKRDSLDQFRQRCC